MRPDQAAAEGPPQVTVLDDHGDQRGSSFSIAQQHLEFVGAPKDMHVACIQPGHTRGNHFHATRNEFIVVVHDDDWSFHWDTGPDGAPSSRTFEGQGAVAILIPPYAAHALRNDGGSPMWLIAATDGPYDPQNPDAYKRVVAPA